jgi:hypothetical protein
LGLDIVGLSKASIFGAIVIVFSLLKKGNIILIGVLIANIGGYLNTYAIYTKGEFDLFCMFTSTLRGYNKKKESYRP